MKNNFLKVVLLAAILFAGASCVKDSVDNAGNETAVKTGSITLASSRVSFDGSSFEWKSGDQIGVSFIGVEPDMTNMLGTISVNNGVAQVVFEYPAYASIDNEQFVLYHPYNPALDGMGDWATEIKFNVSPRQVQPGTGINVACLPLLSAPTYYTEGEEVTLYNLGSIVKFNVYGNADEIVKSVSISTDGYGGVFSSGAATLKYTEVAATEAVGKDVPVSLTRTDEGDAFAAQCSYKGDNNGVDVTLANPTYSGANRANGAVAYAVVYPFGAGSRAKNTYISVTTDKALYTWTRNLTAERGAGLVLNLNLANADDRYTVQSYTNLFKSKLAPTVKTNFPNEAKYAMGTRTWMTANLNWAGYDDALGVAAGNANYAAYNFGRHYSYYVASATAEPASGSGWDVATKYSRSKMAIEGNTTVDEMGLTYKAPAFTFGYKHDGTDYQMDGKNVGQNIAVHLDPQSASGKAMRTQLQYNCPKGWHLPSQLDVYHLFMAVSDTYASLVGTSWSNGEPGWGGTTATTSANPFYNSACSGQTDNAAKAPGNLGLTNLGPLAHWMKGSDNVMNGGIWANYTDKDKTKGYLSSHTEPLFATQACYEYIFTTANAGKCNPATYLKNGVRDDVAFNALPSGFGGTGGLGQYFCLLTAGNYVAFGQNGFCSVLQFDYNQSRFRSIMKARSNASFKGSVRCVKNYVHCDVASDAPVGSWNIADLKWNEEIDF